jgi:hypothetical protein
LYHLVDCGRHNQFFDLTVAGLVINTHDSLLRMRDWAIDTRDTRARDDGPRISYYVY